MALIDFTLSDARRFYSSMGNPLGWKGLKAWFSIFFDLIFSSTLMKNNYCSSLRLIQTRGLAPRLCPWGTLQDQSSSTCTNNFKGILQSLEQNFDPTECSTMLNSLNKFGSKIQRQNVCSGCAK